VGKRAQVEAAKGMRPRHQRHPHRPKTTDIISKKKSLTKAAGGTHLETKKEEERKGGQESLRTGPAHITVAERKGEQPPAIHVKIGTRTPGTSTTQRLGLYRAGPEGRIDSPCVPHSNIRRTQESTCSSWFNFAGRRATAAKKTIAKRCGAAAGQTLDV